jgi:hypothetical protein
MQSAASYPLLPQRAFAFAYNHSFAQLRLGARNNDWVRWVTEPIQFSGLCEQNAAAGGKSIVIMVWLYLLLGLVVGVLSGIIGIGGGVLLVPALIYLFHENQRQAQGTSLAALLAPVGALAFLEYYRAGEVNVKAAVFITIGFIIGGYFGGLSAQHIPETVLRRVFGVVLLALGLQMLFNWGPK